MIRFGYVSRDQLPERLQPSGRLPELSFAMLAEFDDKLSARDEVAIEIISRLDTSRTTYVRRHASLDDVIEEEIERNFKPTDAVRIHDAAVSNAITSVNLFEKVKSRSNIALHASDHIVELLAVTIPGSRWRVVFDAKKRPLQFVGRRMVLPASNRRPPRGYPINRLIRQILRLTVLPQARRHLERAETSPSDNIERIGTFHPRAVALARRDSRFSLGWADMNVPLAGPFEIVRAMNVFFSATPKQVEDALQGICAPLVEGGLLVVGQNLLSTDENLTTIFKRQGRQLIPLRDIAGGARAREVALGLLLH